MKKKSLRKEKMFLGTFLAFFTFLMVFSDQTFAEIVILMGQIVKIIG